MSNKLAIDKQKLFRVVNRSYNGHEGRTKRLLRNLNVHMEHFGNVGFYAGSTAVRIPQQWRRHREFMLDFVGWRRQKDRIGSPVLGVEVEWSKRKWEIRYDFVKLLSFKAPLKLMIYRVSRESGQDVRRALEEELGGFALDRDETYLFAEFEKGKMQRLEWNRSKQKLVEST